MAAPEEGTPIGEGDHLAQGAGEPAVAEEPSIVQEHDPSAQGTPHRTLKGTPHFGGQTSGGQARSWTLCA